MIYSNTLRPHSKSLLLPIYELNAAKGIKPFLNYCLSNLFLIKLTKALKLILNLKWKKRIS